MTREKTIIGHAVQFVENALAREATGHDWQHIRRVWHNARYIAASEDVSIYIVELAALLHDLDDWKLTGARPGDRPERAIAIMQELEVDEATQRAVEEVIQNIDFKGANELAYSASTEIAVVHDADKLDAMGAVGIARCFAFNGASGRPLFRPELWPETELDVSSYTDLQRERNTAVNHFFDKLLHLKNRMQTATGRKMADERHDFLVTYLQQFFAEAGEEEWRSYLDSWLVRHQ